ncbi:MAG: hypothetical protein D6798_12645 [Deltaproteobacteria bacterium]|nr:MAG: hypothetical protein D6798_12645 [Deltaproteobacteria bacterium]
MPIPLLPLGLVALLAGGNAFAGQHPAGATITNAASADITPTGFDTLAAILPALVPTGLEIPDMGDDSTLYAYSLSGGTVDIEIVDVSLVPQTGYLSLDADMLVSVNSPSDPMSLYYEIIGIGDTCDGWVDPFSASLQTTLAMQVVDGVLDAQVGTINVGYDLASDDIHLESCALGSLEEVLNWFGLSLYDLILGMVSDQLTSAVADFGPEIEALIEDAFASATIQEQVDLNGVTADLELYPSDVQIQPSGMRLIMDGSMSASEPADCVAAYDPGGSLATASSPPSIGAVPAGIDPAYDVGLLLSDDFTNQLLYSVWRGGLLCYSLLPGDDTLPIPLDTNLLGLLAGDSFDELFVEPQPMILQTRPKAPPTVDYESDSDLGVDVHQLGLEFYGELDHRQALILAADLDVQAGVDFDLDATSGELGIVLALSGDDVTTTVTDNEFVPDATADIEASFGGAFDTLIGPIIDGLAGDLAFSLPAFEGLGLTSLEFATTGSARDWLGGYATLGPVSYGKGGCDSGGGCDMGCASGSRAPGSGWLLVGLPLGLAALRRRRIA